ncbi:hypothetical protein BX285_6960 [Streptomyces sp. 1114.5]|uniref:hypothetical protein n=1 Tax=Streptomyces sp. 1114.5 TaxID=1938830 RepID=UPI000EB27312|nr:hypothetical protein [Streptomyces sp. 1114.5]RKT09851.1 hypothetical protein BX285_6960 [Streptomyces sp. 1114.5]
MRGQIAVVLPGAGQGPVGGPDGVGGGARFGFVEVVPPGLIQVPGGGEDGAGGVAYGGLLILAQQGLASRDADGGTDREVGPPADEEVQIP